VVAKQSIDNQLPSNHQVIDRQPIAWQPPGNQWTNNRVATTKLLIEK